MDLNNEMSQPTDPDVERSFIHNKKKKKEEEERQSHQA